MLMQCAIFSLLFVASIKYEKHCINWHSSNNVCNNDVKRTVKLHQNWTQIIKKPQFMQQGQKQRSCNICFWKPALHTKQYSIFIDNFVFVSVFMYRIFSKIRPLSNMRPGTNCLLENIWPIYNKTLYFKNDG